MIQNTFLVDDKKSILALVTIKKCRSRPETFQNRNRFDYHYTSTYSKQALYSLRASQITPKGQGISKFPFCPSIPS